MRDAKRCHGVPVVRAVQLTIKNGALGDQIALAAVRVLIDAIRSQGNRI